MQRKHALDLERIIERTTSDYSIRQTRGGHISVEIRRAGRKAYVPVSSTPSDHRALRNFAVAVRRAHRRLIAEAAAGESQT